MVELGNLLSRDQELGELRDTAHWKMMFKLVLKGLREYGVFIEGGFMNEGEGMNEAASELTFQEKAKFMFQYYAAAAMNLLPSRKKE